MENMKKKFAKKKKEGEEGEEGAEGGEEGGEETEVKISLLGGTLVRIYWQLFWRLSVADLRSAPGMYSPLGPISSFLPPANKVWGKVMFLLVCHSVQERVFVWCHFLSGCLVPLSFWGVSVSGPMFLPGGLCLRCHVPSGGPLSREENPGSVTNLDFPLSSQWSNILKYRFYVLFTVLVNIHLR